MDAEWRAAAEFGPLALQAVREAMIGKDWCRKHINKQVARVKRMFKWATRQQMIPGGVYEALRCVDGFKRGRTEAREGRNFNGDGVVNAADYVVWRKGTRNNLHAN